jgi:hypothetical protein
MILFRFLCPGLDSSYAFKKAVQDDLLRRTTQSMMDE